MIKPLVAAFAAAPLLFAIPDVQAAPSLANGARAIDSNAICRGRARSKLLELGARNLNAPSDNYQFGVVNDMSVAIWCYNNQYAIVTVAGEGGATGELRTEVISAF